MPEKGKAPRRYSLEEKEQAYTALALWNGSAPLARAALADQGLEIPLYTLKSWKSKDPDRYHEAERRVLNEIWARTSTEWRAVNRNAANLANSVVDKARTTLEGNGKPSEIASLATAAKNLALTGGIANDKAAMIDQRPAQPTGGDLNPAELVKAINDRFGHVLAVDSTATEIEAGPESTEPTSPES